VADDNSRIRLVHHNATEIIPLSWDNNKNIIDVAFVDQYKIKNESFIDLRIHNLEDSGYVIYNKRLKVFGDNYTIEKDNDTLDKFETHSSIPWFYILKLPIVNNYDINSPMGMSVYGNAIDVLKNVDDAFNALSIEYKTSAKKVFYNKSLLNTNDKGEPIDPDTANQTAFYYVGDTNNPMLSQDTPIKEHDPNIRVDELTKGLESALGYLSALCGLGNSYYKFTSGSVVKTATEVVSENSSMYRNIRKNELAVEKMLLGLFRGILNISNLLYGTSFDIDTHISVMFDTSIIEDKSSIRERDLKEVELGIMTIDEYREKWYNVNRRDTSNKTKVDME
jgi:A118 family predicted phage portal protein